MRNPGSPAAREQGRLWPRLNRFDYRQPGAYFITICTYRRQLLFGKVGNDLVRLSRWGKIAARCWQEIPVHFPKVSLDAAVFMPDHMHGILLLDEQGPQRRDAGTTHASSLPIPGTLRHTPKGPWRGSLSAIVGGYKSSVSRSIHRGARIVKGRIWQRGFYDRVIRDEDERIKLCEYILSNPSRWRPREDWAG